MGFVASNRLGVLCRIIVVAGLTIGPQISWASDSSACWGNPHLEQASKALDGIGGTYDEMVSQVSNDYQVAMAAESKALDDTDQNGAQLLQITQNHSSVKSFKLNSKLNDIYQQRLLLEYENVTEIKDLLDLIANYKKVQSMLRSIVDRTRADYCSGGTYQNKQAWADLKAAKDLMDSVSRQADLLGVVYLVKENATGVEVAKLMDRLQADSDQEGSNSASIKQSLGAVLADKKQEYKLQHDLSTREMKLSTIQIVNLDAAYQALNEALK
jgi:hypothetical protein